MGLGLTDSLWAMFKKYKEQEHFGNWICFHSCLAPTELVPFSCYLVDRHRSRIRNVLALVWNEYYFMISEPKLNRLCARGSEMQL
jgi:hypothetical protein